MAKNTIPGRIGIRQEDKDHTEQRAPLTPKHVQELTSTHGIEVLVCPAPNRIFEVEQYQAAGALITEDLSRCNIIFGVKEIPVDAFLPEHAYCFFSHTIKGQHYNMSMLQKMLEMECTLIDYEKVTDGHNRRLILFGEFAGYAGMIDSMWTLGQRLLWEGIPTPFAELKQANKYPSLQAARQAVREIGEKIRRDGLPDEICPFVCGFTGSGHVSHGAQEIYDLLQPAVVEPENLHKTEKKPHLVQKAIFQRQHRFRPASSDRPFSATEFAGNPGAFENNFEQYLPYLSILINGVYWEPGQPKLVTEQAVKSLYASPEMPRLRVIGDITNDIRGSIECNYRATNSDNPVYVYNPFTRETIDGWEDNGPVILAVDKLPSELPREASAFFGDALLPFVPSLAHANFELAEKHLELPPAFARAVIAHQGQLTESFRYLQRSLQKTT